MDAFPVNPDVVHGWYVTTSCIGDVGEVFLGEHRLELFIQDVGSGFGVAL